MNAKLLCKKETYSKKKARIRQEKIVEILKTQNISRDELKDLLHISESCLKNDLFSLRYSGYNIESHLGMLSLSPSDNIFFDYNPITNFEIHKWIILSIIKKYGPLKFSEIDKEYREIIPVGGSCTDKIHATLNLLRKEKLVLMNSKSLYSSICPDTFITLDTDNIIDLELSCLNNSPRLKHIRKKINDYWDFNFYSLSKKVISSAKLNELLETFSKSNYKERAISFEYTSLSGTKTQVPHFYTGKFIYSREKNVLFILGRTHPKKEVYKLQRVDCIDPITISETSEKNIFYDSTEFNTIVDEMFDMALDKHHVNVKFAYSPTINNKITQLSNYRGSSKISYQSNKQNIYLQLNEIPDNEEVVFLLYEDTIRGLGGFANYLRQFGTNVTVLSDQSLIDQMKETATRTLEHYKIKERIQHER